MRLLQGFWVAEVAYFGPLSSTLTMLSFVQIHEVDFDLQTYLQKLCVTNHSAVLCEMFDGVYVNWDYTKIYTELLENSFLVNFAMCFGTLPR